MSSPFCSSSDGIPDEMGGGAASFTELYNAVFESGSFSTTSSGSYVQITGSTLTLPGTSSQIYLFWWQSEIYKNSSPFDVPHVRCQDITTPVSIGEGIAEGGFSTPAWDIRGGFKRMQLSVDTTFQLQLEQHDAFGPVFARRCRMWALLIG